MKSKKLVLLMAALLVSAVGCGPKQEPLYIAYEAAGYESVDAMEKDVLGAYDAKYRAAAAITDASKIKERYQKFAEAEYSLIYEEGIIVPWYTASGYSASVARTVPWQAGRSSYGLTADKLKNVVVTNSAITKEQREAVTAAYEAGKEDVAVPTVDAEGWTSLANPAANPALTNGKYVAGGIEFTPKNEYKMAYASEIDKDNLNYLVNTWTYNSAHYTNMVDGLVENNKYGAIVGALAESYKITRDAEGHQVWSFKLRDGLQWVDNTGAKKADLTAADFVTSAKYVLDPNSASGTVNLVTGFILGAQEYYDAKAAGEEADFSKVGVKAEGNVISYTMIQDCPYFNTVLTYSPYLPTSAALLEEKGTDFGKTVNDIWVCGAFRVTEHTPQSKIVYEKNASYWDKDHVYVDKVTQQFYSSAVAQPDTLRTWYANGDVDSFTVQATDEVGWKTYVAGEEGTGTQRNPAHAECNGILSMGDATYIGYFNFNRSTFEVNNKEYAKTNAEKLNTTKALLNKNLRLAFVYGLDVQSYFKRLSPTEPYNYIMRAYTNRNLVADPDGKDYADYVEDVFNQKQGTTGVSLAGINAQKDPTFDKAKAKSLLEAAKAELIAGGMSEKAFPIKIDVIGSMTASVQVYEKAMYAALEEAGEGIIEIQYNVPVSDDQDQDWGSISSNYDFSMWSGWGPDYADPNTFLHTMAIDGDMVEMLGF